MSSITLLCVDDEPDVLEAVERDMAPFEDVFNLELAASASEAEVLIEKATQAGQRIGLIFCDHVMPGKNGVDLLIELNQKEETRKTRKVLLTGQAGLEATVEAVNRAQLNHYVAKPWSAQALRDVAREQLTDYIIGENINPLPYMKHLDPLKINEAMRRGKLLGDEG